MNNSKLNDKPLLISCLIHYIYIKKLHGSLKLLFCTLIKPFVPFRSVFTQLAIVFEFAPVLSRRQNCFCEIRSGRGKDNFMPA